MRALEAKLTIYRNDSEITHVNSSGRMRSVSVLTRTDASQITSTAKFGPRSVTGDTLAQCRVDRGRRPYTNRAERPKDARNRLIWGVDAPTADAVCIHSESAVAATWRRHNRTPLSTLVDA